MFVHKFILLFSLICLSQAAPAEDEIQHLPGLNYAINFRHYSGYLKGLPGDYLHYWFVTSQSNPSKDPVVLWLNGGPGCSSLDGLLNELGPYHLSLDGKHLYQNDYSWNKIANVLFIEAPVCVGFSYTTKGDCDANDDRTSLSNFHALLSFFEKFPEFKDNDFYVTGESYGGIYVPTLTKRIVERMNTSQHINIKGFAVGNGLSSYSLNDDSIIFFAYYHGLIGTKLWNYGVNNCCKNGVASRFTCNFNEQDNSHQNSKCRNFVEQVAELIFDGDSRLNMYNLYGECVNSTDGLNRYHMDRANIFKSKKSLYKLKGTGLDPPCTDAGYMREFLNNAYVKKALHIPDGLPDWDVCININYKTLYENMTPQYQYLLQYVRGMIYNGDVDMACNFLGDEWFVDDLSLKELSPRKIWYNDHQVGGFWKKYENLDLVTIRGAGHMVPQDKPGPAFQMFETFLKGN